MWVTCLFLRRFHVNLLVGCFPTTATPICTSNHSTLCYSSSKSLVATTYYNAVGGVPGGVPGRVLRGVDNLIYSFSIHSGL